MGFAVSFFESGLAQMHLDLGSLQTEVSGLLLHVADGEVEMLRLAQHGNFISLKTGDFGWTKVLWAPQVHLLNPFFLNLHSRTPHHFPTQSKSFR